MHVLPHRQVPIGLPSPTLTNPDMVLPHKSPSSESSPSTPRNLPRLPSPPTAQRGHRRAESTLNEKPRAKNTMSPFRNGVLRRHDGSIRLKSSSERGDRRMSNEQSRFSYQPNGDSPFASSPTLHGDFNGIEQWSYTDNVREDDDLVESRNTTYHTPSILEEDENNPYSHAAMTRRAEEILANAKKRLTVRSPSSNCGKAIIDSD